MLGAFKFICVLVIAIIACDLVDSQQATSVTVTRSRRVYSPTTTARPYPNRTTTFGRRLHHNRTHHYKRTRPVELADKDKYYENRNDGDYEYEEDYDDEYTTNSSRDDTESKFIEGDTGIVLDHVEFVLLRLKHILMGTSSNLTEILEKQKQEFKKNKSYREGWEAAVQEFRKSKKAKIFKNSKSNSIVRTVPEEYHIAILAYTLGEPSMYADFNRDTREVCSGTDVANYQWKSYFKLLHLAIQTLGSNEDKFRDNSRFLYRGATLAYNLKEGQVLAFQHFISTSASLDVAEEFANKKTLFEFQGLYNGTAMNIQDFSFYEYEKETLFSPVETFQVDSIHKGKHYTRYVLVKHEIPPPCDKDKDKVEQDGALEKINVKDNSLRYASSGKTITQQQLIVFITLFLSLVLPNYAIQF